MSLITNLIGILIKSPTARSVAGKAAISAAKSPVARKVAMNVIKSKLKK